MRPSMFHDRRGFTLVEVLVATALLGFSLVVMFGFHVQAVRSNLHARKITDCTYLAQDQLERLVAYEWTSGAGRSSTPLADGNVTATSEWAPLYHPSSGGYPSPVNAIGETTASTYQPAPSYYITWEVDPMDLVNDTWIRVRVRCTYYDAAFDTYRGTTISTFRYRDN